MNVMRNITRAMAFVTRLAFFHFGSLVIFSISIPLFFAITCTADFSYLLINHDMSNVDMTDSAAALPIIILIAIIGILRSPFV